MKKILCVILSTILSVSAMVSFAFDDVKDSHWAKEYIEKLTDMNVINGYEDSTFKPENNVTRAEFVKMLSLSFEPESKGGFFEDVESHWAKEYIEKCADVFPAEGKEFLPDTNATREEIAASLSTVLNLPKSDSVRKISEMFKDSESVSEKLSDKVASAVQAGIIEGYENGEIRGGNPVTRAEVCTLIVRALEYKEKEGTQEPETDEEVEPEKPDKEENQGNGKEENVSDLEHIYTLVPGKNLLLVTSSRETRDEKTGDRAVRLNYVLSGDDTEYSSVVSEGAEIDILGGRTSLFEIEKGDILLIDSGFLRHIDRIFVLSCLGDNINQGKNIYVPDASKIGEKGSDKKYELVAGKIESKKSKDKSVVVTLEDGEIVSIPRSVDINLYHPMLKSPWESASPTSVTSDDAVLFARYTEGVVTEAVVAVYAR